MTLDVSPQDNVGSIVDLLEPNKMAELRHVSPTIMIDLRDGDDWVVQHGEFENLAKDLNLLDVGVSQPMQVDLMISDMMKGPHPSRRLLTTHTLPDHEIGDDNGPDDVPEGEY